jgi:septum formation topological specificity factor MinE
MTCIVFLNFIIAEASNSYSNVKERLSAIINKEKASLISEAETMVFES